MTVSFMPYVHNETKERWDWPQAARDNPDAFDLTLSNANAADLLLALGLANAPYSEAPIPIQAFSNLVTAALRRHLSHRSPELGTVEDAAPGKILIIHCGRDGGYIERRLGNLAKLVQDSRAAGATHIGWG